MDGFKVNNHILNFYLMEKTSIKLNVFYEKKNIILYKKII